MNASLAIHRMNEASASAHALAKAGLLSEYMRGYIACKIDMHATAAGTPGVREYQHQLQAGIEALHSLKQGAGNEIEPGILARAPDGKLSAAAARGENGSSDEEPVVPGCAVGGSLQLGKVSCCVNLPARRNGGGLVASRLFNPDDWFGRHQKTTLALIFLLFVLVSAL